jgi:hypothetical protein
MAGTAKHFLTLDDAIQKVKIEDSRYCRRILPANSVRIHDEYLSAGSDAYLLNAQNLSVICKAANAPSEYLTKLPNKLRTELLAHHFREGLHLSSGKRLDVESVMVATEGKRRLVAFDRADLALLSGVETLEATCNGIGRDNCKDIAIHSIADHLTVNILSHVSVEPRVDDIVRAGVQVSYSLLGKSAIRVFGFLERLVCGNGAVSESCIDDKLPRTRRLPIGHPEAKRLQMEQVKSLAGHAWSAIQDKLPAMKDLAANSLGGKNEIRNHLSDLFRQARLSVRQQDRSQTRGRNLLNRLEEAWKEEGEDTSAFGVTNAVTRLATHDTELTHRERYQLFRIGEVLAFQSKHLCPRCFSLINQDMSTSRLKLIGQRTGERKDLSGLQGIIVSTLTGAPTKSLRTCKCRK